MSATQPIGVDSTPVSSETAVRQQLDALSKGEIDHVTFLDNMKERFRFDPDDNWEVLSLLDQYYRRGKINLEVFRELKSGFAEYILGPQNPAPSQQGITPTLHTVVMTPPSAAPAPAVHSAVGATPARPAATPAAVATAAATHPIFAGPAPSPPPLAPTFARVHASPPPAQQPAAHQPPAQQSSSQQHAYQQQTAPLATFRNASGSAPTLSRSAADVDVAPVAAAAAAAGASTAAAPLRDAEVGDLLRNRYRLDGLIARGASGVVFEANDPFRLNLPPSGKRVAIKVLRCPDPRGVFINQLRQEFHHLQQLSHPNIVRAFDFDRDGGLAFFTMELLDGDHLNRTLQARGKPLERPQALAVIRDVGAALAHAHSRGIAHGDLNPQNVFITTNGEIRVLGFGASNKLSGTADAPAFDQVSARSDSYRFASCEVLQGGRPDSSDDLYSLSCLAYVLLSGKHPFAELNSIEARAERRSPRRPPGLGNRQWQTLRKGLQTDAQKRPSDVQSWLHGMQLGAAVKQLPPANELIDTAARTPRPRRWAIAALIAAVLIGGGYWLSNQYRFGPQPTTAAADGDAVSPDADTPGAAAAGAVAPGASVPGAAGMRAAGSPGAASLPAAQPPNAGAPGSAAPPMAAAPRPSTKVSATPPPPPAAVVARATPPAATAAPVVAHPGPQAPGASKVEMAVDTMDASLNDSVVHVTVRRKGNLHGQTSFTWWTESGTAKPGVDFVAVLPHVQQMQDGEASIVLSVPVLSTVRSQEKGFYVGIEEADGGAQIGARSLTQITLPPTN